MLEKGVLGHPGLTQRPYLKNNLSGLGYSPYSDPSTAEAEGSPYPRPAWTTCDT